MSKTRPDAFPLYPAAGLKKEVGEEATSLCLQPPDRNLSTPEEIVKYRKSFKEQTGVSIPHYGLADIQRSNIHPHGVPTEKSEKLGQVLQGDQANRAKIFLEQLQEQKYLSNKQEPLGRAVDRGYNMPSVCGQNDFRFGQPTETNIYGAKETIYSAENMPEEEAVREMYLKSHKDYDPGEQKKRDYKWPVDPTDFRFGLTEKNVVHKEIHQILAPEAHSSDFPRTAFVKSNLHDFLDRKEDKLGKPMNLGQQEFSPDRVFGVRVEPNQWDAGKCLRGDANAYEVRPDDDLGHSTRYGCRNIVKPGDEQRVFGVPTIRYDIKKPEKQSVADPNNYADETVAIELLFPPNFSAFGIDEKDFEKCLPKLEIKEIFENIGFKFKLNIFEAIFSRAKAIEGTILDRVSCKSFKASLMELCP